MLRTTPLLVLLGASASTPAMAFVGFDDAESPWYGFSHSDAESDEDAPSVEAFRSIFTTGLTPPAADYSSVSGPLSLGFQFDFYGETYDKVWIVSGGALSFGALGGSSPSVPQQVPSTALPNGFIAAGWYNFSSWQTEIRYAIRGRAPERQFVVEWHHPVSYYSYSPYSTSTTPDSGVVQQVILDERFGDITVYVSNATTQQDSLCVAIESPDGSRGVAAYLARPDVAPLAQYAAVFSPYLQQPRIDLAQSGLTVPEGGTVEVPVRVADRQDDVASVTWDLNQDGKFDDAQGLSALVSAEGLDGPGSLVVGVKAEDREGNGTEESFVLAITNLPPVFVNEPPTEAPLGRQWEYVPQVFDPGGDQVTVSVLERPAGMILMANGTLRWRPREADVGLHTLVLVARDDDDDPKVKGDGDSTLQFELNVTHNRPPQRPTIVRPLAGETVSTRRPSFVVDTPTDEDSDTLYLVFEIDTVNTFDSPDLISSGNVEVTVGRTGWTCPEALQEGEHYWWRVYATDGYSYGPAVRGDFVVDIGKQPGEQAPDLEEPDGTGTENPRQLSAYGCSVGPLTSEGSSLRFAWGLVWLMAWPAFRRRRAA